MFTLYNKGNKDFHFLLTIGILVTVTNAQAKESMTDQLQLFLYLNKIGFGKMH